MAFPPRPISHLAPTRIYLLNPMFLMPAFSWGTPLKKKTASGDTPGPLMLNAPPRPKKNAQGRHPRTPEAERPSPP